MMSKRLTDTEVWGKPYFRRVPPRIKLFWKFLNDNCDLGGMWDGDFESASFHIGEEVGPKDFDDFPELFKGRVEPFEGGKWFLPTFVTFQYRRLSGKSQPQLAVIKCLEKHGLLSRFQTLIHDYDILDIPFPNPSQTVKDRIRTGQGGGQRQDKDGKRLFGENVRMTEEEFRKITERLKDERRTKQAIDILDNYLGQNESNKKRYTSHYRAILNWVIPELIKREEKKVIVYPRIEKIWKCDQCGKEMPESRQYHHWGECPKLRSQETELNRRTTAHE